MTEKEIADADNFGLGILYGFVLGGILGGLAVAVAVGLL